MTSKLAAETAWAPWTKDGTHPGEAERDHPRVPRAAENGAQLKIMNHF